VCLLSVSASALYLYLSLSLCACAFDGLLAVAVAACTRFGGSSLTTPNRSEHIVLWIVEVADYDSHHVYLKNIATQTWLTGRPGQTATMTPHKDEVNGRFELIVQVPLAARWVCSHQ